MTWGLASEQQELSHYLGLEEVGSADWRGKEEGRRAMGREVCEQGGAGKIVGRGISGCFPLRFG